MRILKLLVILLSLIIWSCIDEEPVNYTILSGNISNTKGGELKISALSGFSKTINVKDTGIFSDTLFIDESGLYNVRYGDLRFSAYLTQGANVKIDANDKEPIKSLKLSGDYAELNIYYVYKAGKEYDFMMDRGGSYKVAEDAFEIKIKNFQKDLETQLEAVEHIPDGVKEKELRALNYSRLSKKASYESMYGYLTENRGFKASHAFKKELEDVSYENGEDYLYSSDYQRMVSNKIRTKAYEFYEKESLSYQEANAKALFEVKNQTIKNGELYKAISMRLPMSKDKDKDLQDFVNASTNQKHIEKIKELYESLKALDKGQPSPKFNNYENYAGGTTSLDDLKGKYVYIDVWATWCGPCKYEIPFLKKIEEQYHEKNIHFVSISADKQKDKDKWKKMITEKEMGGIQLITDNNFNTSFISEYKIMGIPQFILLDPKGNIVQANAPRPSDKKLVDLFTELGI